MKHHRFGYSITSLALIVALLIPKATRAATDDAINAHQSGAQLKRIFEMPARAEFKPTGVTRADYLKLIAANVDFFKKHQNADGAIIDPVSNGERQYSTPAFAAAAGLLVKEAGRRDLLDPAGRAMSCALTALVSKRAADSHADFYIPLLVHAHRFLKDVVPAEQARKWEEQFQAIDPDAMYRADLRGMNWNIVSSSGELLRRKDGLVAPDRLDAQMQYLERCLAGHMKTLTPLGLFEDPGAPMAYDAFSRLWLEDVYADNAYAGGAHASEIEKLLTTGGLSTLLLLSPSGEWASGGRSALHNWTDLECAAICEMNAARWKKLGRDDVAGAFKRAAHLAFQSAARWQRPSGELWIIKNRAEPPARLAYERYSNHSQYNLLPMAMLAIAYSRADESVAERPSVSEVGGYVFDARQTFHKIAAVAGGYYVLIDTAADTHYNATGLQRVHRAGVAFPALSDSAAGERDYEPKDAPKAALAPGIAWKSAEGNADWLSIADFSGGKAKRFVKSADLKVESAEPGQVAFEVGYVLTGDGENERLVTERYEISSDGVRLTTSVQGSAQDFRAQFPVLVNDGAADTEVKLDRNRGSISERGSTTTLELPADQLTSPLALEGPRLVTHNGYVRAATAGVKSNSVTVTITLHQK